MEESYIVSARKYRPSTFSTVVGQKALTSTLRNAIATNRLAHAYLFCGSRGVGKTSCARIFAKTINCEHPTENGDPCNECASCRQFNENRSLNILELDAASNNSVNDIRDLIGQVLVPPTEGRYKVFIIDEVHMLSPAAFNAFLKTLEEPPSYVIFILATTEKHKIIPTILSRCQIYDFSRITIADIVDHLQYVASQEGITAERSALNVIARKADGAMRDALSIFDQVAASSRGNITYKSAIDNLNELDERYYSRLFEAFRTANVAEALLTYKEIRDKGFDSLFFINGLAEYLRNLMVARNPQTLALLDADESVKETMSKQAAQLSPEFFYAAMSLCNDADLNYRQSSNKTFLVELLLIKLCQLCSPSPDYSGSGEGHKLKKLEPVGGAQAAPQAQAATAMQQPAQPAATATSQTQRVAPPSQQTQKTMPAASAQPPAAPSSQSGVAYQAPPPQPPAPQRRAAASPHSDLLKHVSLADLAKPQVQQQQQQQTQRLNRKEVFTIDDLNRAWEDFQEDNPRQHVLINTMRVAYPKSDTREDAPIWSYVVTVSNPVQKEEIENNLGNILEYLRNRLKNDHISISVVVDDTAVRPTVMSNRELLTFLTEKNPELQRMISDLNLTLQ